MSLDNITSITDITDAIKALSEKTSALESELSACQSEVSRLNRANSRLLADNTKLEKLENQFCLVHLIRNLQYLSDINSSQKWSSDMQLLFRDGIHESNNAEARPGKEARNK